MDQDGMTEKRTQDETANQTPFFLLFLSFLGLLAFKGFQLFTVSRGKFGLHMEKARYIPPNISAGVSKVPAAGMQNTSLKPGEVIESDLISGQLAYIEVYSNQDLDSMDMRDHEYVEVRCSYTKPGSGHTETKVYKEEIGVTVFKRGGNPITHLPFQVFSKTIGADWADFIIYADGLVYLNNTGQPGASRQKQPHVKPHP